MSDPIEIKVPPEVLARERLGKVAPHLRAAARDAKLRAKPDARTWLAVIAKNPDGSGQVGAELELDEFLADLELLLGSKP